MYKVASFFSGVGGIDLGFKNAGNFETVYANEFDKYARETMQLNFPNVTIDPRDIRQVVVDEIPDFDILVGGFPCQAFSIAGLRQGFQDEKGRGELFFELIRIMKEKQPIAAFFENVKNLVTHDNGNTFRIIKEELENLGYFVTHKVLNASKYGNIPQNRERIYIVAFRDREVFEEFLWCEEIEMEKNLFDVIDFRKEVSEKYYYKEGKFNGDIYEKLLEATLDDDRLNPSVYQWRRKYVRKNKHHLIPTLTANQGTGGHNVCIIKTETGIRKMTPRECFNANGFPESFILPKQSDSRLYKQAGNSVCIPVVERIAYQIAIAMDVM